MPSVLSLPLCCKNGKPIARLTDRQTQGRTGIHTDKQRDGHADTQIQTGMHHLRPVAMQISQCLERTHNPDQRALDIALSLPYTTPSQPPV